MSKMNSGYRHEGIDRAATLIGIIDLMYGDIDEDTLHPAIWNERCLNLLRTIQESAAELYQAIGEYEE